MDTAQRIFTSDIDRNCQVCGHGEPQHDDGICPPRALTAREQSEIVAASVRAALVQLRETGTTVDDALDLGIDRAIGNNAAQALCLAGSL